MPGIYDMQRNDSLSRIQLFSKNNSIVVASALVVLSRYDQDRFTRHFGKPEARRKRFWAQDQKC